MTGRVTVAAVLCAICTLRAADEPSLDQILKRAGAYVVQFEKDFSFVVSDEAYEQERVVGTSTVAGEREGRETTSRRLRSEMLFAWIPELQSWLTIRSVLAVNGQPVSGTLNWQEAVPPESAPGRTARLRSLRDVGARFNIGRVYRNFNDPSLVLQFLDPAYQGRFAFRSLGPERVNGLDTSKISFDEKVRPTVVRDEKGEDLSATGTIWIGRSDGAVARTSVSLRHRRSARADLVVDYAHNSKLGMWVPVRMTERYAYLLGPTDERITCTAIYSNFRRFETSARVLPPQ
jgi:hypothetical protein